MAFSKSQVPYFVIFAKESDKVDIAGEDRHSHADEMCDIGAIRDRAAQRTLWLCCAGDKL
jgi:hypothetical protein